MSALDLRDDRMLGILSALGALSHVGALGTLGASSSGPLVFLLHQATTLPVSQQCWKANLVPGTC